MDADCGNREPLVEQLSWGDKLLAIIVRSGFSKPGVNFFTPDKLSQQLAYIKHPSGRLIEPHIRNIVPSEVLHTQEVLVIRRGRLKVDFYDDDCNCIESRVLQAGDVILLAEGGHGFEVLEELEMIEIKQGPYAGEGDKTRFARG